MIKMFDGRRAAESEGEKEKEQATRQEIGCDQREKRDESIN